VSQAKANEPGQISHLLQDDQIVGEVVALVAVAADGTAGLQDALDVLLFKDAVLGTV
jgi:hypothetical protein